MKKVTEYIDAVALTTWVTRMGESEPVWSFLTAIRESANDDGLVPVEVLRSQRELEQADERDHILRERPWSMERREMCKDAKREPYSDLDGLQARLDSGGFKLLFPKPVLAFIVDADSGDENDAPPVRPVASLQKEGWFVGPFETFEKAFQASTT